MRYITAKNAPQSAISLANSGRLLYQVFLKASGRSDKKMSRVLMKIISGVRLFEKLDFPITLARRASGDRRFLRASQQRRDVTNFQTSAPASAAVHSSVVRNKNHRFRASPIQIRFEGICGSSRGGSDRCGNIVCHRRHLSAINICRP